MLYCLDRWKVQNGTSKPCVHRIDCACLVHKICGYYSYEEGVFVQIIIRSTVQFSLFLHPDQAQNTSSGIQGQEATAVAVI